MKYGKGFSRHRDQKETGRGFPVQTRDGQPGIELPDKYGAVEKDPGDGYQVGGIGEKGRTSDNGLNKGERI